MAAQAHTDRILNALSSGVFSPDVLDAIRHLSPDDKTDLLENNLLHALATSDDNKLRNASALALADLNSRIAPLVINGLLLSSRTRGSRATLLYALKEMQGKINLWLAVNLVTNDTNGTREEVLDFLEDGTLEPFTEAQKKAALNHLKSVLKHEKSDARQLILQNAIDLLGDLKAG